MAYVGSNTGYNSGPITLVSGSAPAGCTVVAGISGDSAQTTTTLPAGWSKQTPMPLTGGVSVCLWVYDNWPGGAVSAAITNPPGDCGWSVQSHSGRDTTSAVEAYNHSNGSGATWTSATLTATAGADAVFYMGQENAAGTPTVTTSGYTKRTEQTSHVHCMGDDENVSAGSISCSGSPGGSVFWGTAFLSLKASAGGGGAVSPPLRRRYPQLTYR